MKAANSPQKAQPNPPATTLRIRSTSKRSSNLLIDLPIGARLILGFILAALIASFVTGAIGLQNANSLQGQANFYQTLLRTNTNLTTGSSYLQLMNAQITTILSTKTSAQSSQEDLTKQKDALKSLSDRYDSLLNSYVNNDILVKHPDQMALLNAANHNNQIQQQETLAASTVRTWRVYNTAQKQILQAIDTAQWDEAAHIQQIQGEFMNTDTTSALRALIHFNGKLATSVEDAAVAQQQMQFIYTVVGSVIAFILILVIGWLISGTIISRLRHLRQVTLAVEQGQLDRRVNVVGRDEIADVSASVNAMLTAIVGLLEESRNQRDALTNAAEHLFSDMRVVSAGDLRINAPVSNDPIGMLANAFNFTVGRFRRFVQRTKATAEQLDVLVRQEIERAEAFSQAIQLPKNAQQAFSPQQPTPLTNQFAENRSLRFNVKETMRSPEIEDGKNADLTLQVKKARERLQQLSGDNMLRHTRAVITMGEQISHSITRLSKSLNTQSDTSNRQAAMDVIQMQVRELRLLETVLKRMISEFQNVQNTSSQSLQDLDNDLNHLANAVRNVKSKSGSEPSSTELSEIIRLNTSFANDVIAFARQVAIQAQEIRTGIISFQLDTVESGNALGNTSFPGVGPVFPNKGYNLAGDMQRQFGGNPPSGSQFPSPASSQFHANNSSSGNRPSGFRYPEPPSERQF
ncbi:HAMP domain-containing protein [Tengunoibacter tsumagoiensis]|uniref:Methyl-accepting chemotaxis protein n=1 Tax=Tengunoibacter tsumagoiensis TaxID=2014871 RepID=A0A401ZTP7_9CHLR|nr:HAMP domain-containing protein [Tengunoibacter tsumagoiensis]GCE10182.1 methyl-accepting chemotaxis protein [Tengunoibacter tsumagoiensis]